MLADQRKAALESKRIEQSGGKTFYVNIIKMIYYNYINNTKFIFIFYYEYSIILK